MARRGFNALRAALGAVTGVAEGLQQRELLAEKRKREQDTMARQQAMDLASLMAQGWERPSDITQKTGEARGAIGSLVGSALQAASTGVPTGGPSARGMQALESGYATQAAPSRTINVGGMDLALRESPNERQERLASTQAVQQRTAAKETERLKRLDLDRRQSIISRALSPNATEEDKAAAINEGVLTPSQTGYMTAAEQQAAKDRQEGLRLQREGLNLQRERATSSTSGARQSSAMQEMMLARVNVARKQSEAAHQQMLQFENELVAGERKSIGAIEAQLATEMFKDTRFNKIAEAQLNKMNPDLAKYVRNAKAIGAAERLVMPRGGSNLLMNIETALAGVGPGATPDLIRATQAFRTGLVEGVQRETPEGLLGAENARIESAIGTDAERRGTDGVAPTRPPISSFRRK